MKKQILILALIVNFFLVFRADSDTMDCVPDCETDLFDYTVPPLTYMIGTCEVTVYWGWRHACDMYWDIIILSIYYSGASCASIPESDLMDAATLKLLQDPYLQGLSQSPPSFPLPQNIGDCETSWRVNKYYCWSRHVDSFSGKPKLVACNNDPEVPCCLTWYKLCLNSLGHLTYTIQGIDGPPEPCIPKPGFNCVRVCDNDERED